MPNVDLHTHTTASDGSCTPFELVSMANQVGLVALAITDHDTIDGLSEGLQAAKQYGMEVIPGVEISTEFRDEMHILGYYIDRTSQQLQEGLIMLQEFRNERNPRIIKRLAELGVPVTMEDIEKQAGGKVIGRPHIAQALMKKGYVESVNDAFSRFLARGKVAYFPKEKLTPSQGVRLIADAGGIPVLAHPKDLKLTEWELDAVIKDLKAHGLQGIEVWYSTHTEAETIQYLKLAKKYDLAATGGSDYHGFSKPAISLGKGMGELQVDYKCVEQLKARRK